MLKVAHINNTMLFVWWSNIILQSVFELSWLYVAVFLFSSTYVLYKDYRYGVLFLIVSYFVPYTNSFLPSPFLLITFLSFVFYLLSTGWQLKIKISNRYYCIFLFLFLAPIFSILFQGSELSDRTVVTYILSGASLLIYVSIFREFDDKLFFESMLRQIVFFVSITFIVSYAHTLLGETTNLYKNIFIANQSDDFLMKIYTESSMEVRRLIWVGIDPNYFAAQFIFFLLLSLYFSQENTKYYIYSGLIALSIVGTFSRTAFLVMSLSIISAMFFHRQKSKLIILGAISFIFLISYNDYIARIDTIVDNISNEGGTGRFELITASLDVWANNVFGVGIGNLNDAKYGTSGYVTNFSSHSTFFQILVESGVHFFILFLTSIVILIMPIKSIRLDKLSYFSLIGIIFTLIFYITIPVYDFRLFFLIVLIYVTAMRLNMFSKNV